MVQVGFDIQRVDEVASKEHIWIPDVLFTVAELDYTRSSKDPAATLAGLYCAREALYKALGARVECTWTDAEVARGPDNRPLLRPAGALAEFLHLTHSAVDLSISHSGDYASAVVVLTPAHLPPSTPRENTVIATDTSPSVPSVPAHIESTTVELALTVRPNDLDRLGHVNNAVVLEYFETGRQAWQRANHLKVTSVLPVVARADVHYRKEIPETIVTVVTTIASAGYYAAEFRQQLLVGGELAADAQIQVGFVEERTRSLATVEDFFEASQAPRRGVTLV